MSRLEQQFKDLRIITGGDDLFNLKHLNININNPLNSSRSTRSFDPLYQSNSVGINQSYMLLSSPNRNRSTKNLQLSIPKVTSPLISKGSPSKLKKHITYINHSFRNTTSPSYEIAHIRTSTNNIIKSIKNDTFVSSYKNRPPINIDNHKLEFSARTYMIHSPTSRVIPSQPVFKDDKYKNSLALFKSKTTRNNNKGLFNKSERLSYGSGNAKKRNMIINTEMYAGKIKQHLKYGKVKEMSKDDNDFMSFAKELQAWTNKKEYDWKKLY